MESLRRFKVYDKIPGRTIDSDGKSPVVPDVLAKGIVDLTKPLEAYSTLFEQLRARRKRTPLLPRTKPVGECC